MIKRMLATVVAMTVGLLIPHSAAADAEGDKVVASMDASLGKAKSFYCEYEVINKEAGKDEKKLAINQWIKGEKMLLEFTAPADMKGTKILILSATEQYVYLPAFGKVRRIAASEQNQGFLGLAFSLPDLSTRSYGGAYTAGAPTSTDAEIKLSLTPRAGQTVPYSKIEATLRKDNSLPTELKYTSTDGKVSKTEARTGYTCQGDVCTPGSLKMTNNTSGSWTILASKKWKANENIPDSTFTKSNLAK